jgi:hypothetical protein
MNNWFKRYPLKPFTFPALTLHHNREESIVWFLPMNDENARQAQDIINAAQRHALGEQPVRNWGTIEIIEND